MTDSNPQAGRSLAAFTLPVRVYIEDTDAGGIVFHAKYLHFMERARTEWVRSRGVGLRAGLSDNISYVVQKLSIHYAAPGRLDDELLVTADLVDAGRVWMEFDQRVSRKDDGRELARATVRVACVALDTGRPRRLPEDLTQLLKQHLDQKKSSEQSQE
ncbi:acyl-CoA thioester hydrolase [Marinobacter daqiaonensis]|uniref:Acyl-CoA thioester hydrolase n=1 Tax=Marinobacter daqiaonensis TaxID=650891 RepID=A0A1I6H1A5_9GAMM|nr:YbgC/FadM family acyl-CoA thioesterase [Marinobacter daqiaonensis]SFR48233.1 acyl-CoA thioester hydrolase [Marinobacter daqiaonensis]